MSFINDWRKSLEKTELPFRWSLYIPLIIIAIHLLIIIVLRSFLSSTSGILALLCSPQVFFLAALILVSLFLRLKPREIGLSFSGLRFNMLYGIKVSLIPPLLVILFILLPVTFFQLITTGHISILEGFQQGRPSLGLISAIQLLVLSPFAEELFFRGFLIPPLKRSFSLWLSVLLSALIFMSAHGYIKPGAFLLGLFTAVIFIRTGSVIPSIIFHFSCNLWGPLLAYFFPEIYRVLYFLFR